MAMLMYEYHIGPNYFNLQTPRMQRLEEVNHDGRGGGSGGDDKEFLFDDDIDNLEPQIDSRFQEVLHK
jgi:hypothetical protein